MNRSSPGLYEWTLRYNWKRGTWEAVKCVYIHPELRALRSIAKYYEKARRAESKLTLNERREIDKKEFEKNHQGQRKKFKRGDLYSGFERSLEKLRKLAP